MRNSALIVLLAWTLAAQQALCGKLEKVAEQASNILVDYYAYRHISIIHFDVPERIAAVTFKYVSCGTHIALPEFLIRANLSRSNNYEDTSTLFEYIEVSRRFADSRQKKRRWAG